MSLKFIIAITGFSGAFLLYVSAHCFLTAHYECAPRAWTWFGRPAGIAGVVFLTLALMASGPLIGGFWQQAGAGIAAALLLAGLGALIFPWAKRISK